jgi:hypothetical protein
MRWAGGMNGEKRNGYTSRLVERKLEGKRPLRSRCRWVDSIKMDLGEIGWGCKGWSDLAQDRDHWRALINTVMNFQAPYNVGKFLSSCTTGSFSTKVQLHEVSYISVTYYGYIFQPTYSVTLRM